MVANKVFIVLVLFNTACSVTKNTKTGDSKIASDKRVMNSNDKYINWDDFTVLDKNTGLLWQVFSMTDSQNKLYWFDAENHCDNLIHANRNDWQLPTIKELKTLLSVKKSPNNGFINSEYFPLNIPYSYWSSTEGYGHGGWYVDFDAGGDSAYADSKKKYARCVIPKFR